MGSFVTAEQQNMREKKIQLEMCTKEQLQRRETLTAPTSAHFILANWQVWP